MNNLTNSELMRLNFLISKIRSRTATGAEMQEFLSLIQKSGQNNWMELQNYLHSVGYSSIDELQQHLSHKLDQEFTDGLVKIGLAILVAYGLSELFKNR